MLNAWKLGQDSFWGNRLLDAEFDDDEFEVHICTNEHGDCWVEPEDVLGAFPCDNLVSSGSGLTLDKWAAWEKVKIADAALKSGQWATVEAHNAEQGRIRAEQGRIRQEKIRQARKDEQRSMMIAQLVLDRDLRCKIEVDYPLDPDTVTVEYDLADEKSVSQFVTDTRVFPVAWQWRRSREI